MTIHLNLCRSCKIFNIYVLVLHTYSMVFYPLILQDASGSERFNQLSVLKLVKWVGFTSCPRHPGSEIYVLALNIANSNGTRLAFFVICIFTENIWWILWWLIILTTKHQLLKGLGTKHIWWFKILDELCTVKFN